ncbi:hypothetical protein MHYP_G00310480 [Metynnis hypsauchen]
MTLSSNASGKALSAQRYFSRCWCSLLIQGLFPEETFPSASEGSGHPADSAKLSWNSEMSTSQTVKPLSNFIESRVENTQGEICSARWCMASLYKESDWSTKLDTVKNNTVQRLADGSVSLKEMGQKLAKYHSEKDNFSLTDVWSVLIVSNMVNEIDEHKLTEQRGKYTKDPYPVYTVIDKQCKYDRLNAESEQRKASQTPDVLKAPEVLLTLVELNLQALKKEDLTNNLKAMNEHLKDKYKEIEKMTLNQEGVEKSAKTMSQTELKDYTLQACSSISDVCKEEDNKDVESVDSSVSKSKTREYEDSAALLNSPYFSVLRKERDIDLIISLDFSEGYPFKTVVQTAEKCKDLQIPFPEVVVPAENTEPQDFYVFKGSSDAPTVIHIPLFNAVNCKGEIKKWEKTYSTFQMNYSREMITDLLEKAGLNIKNNKGKLLKEIGNVTGQKKTSKLGKV